MKAEEKQITTFEDLEVWQLCRALRKEIYKVTKTFPKDEERVLIPQMRRAAISATANIAEGFWPISLPREHPVLQTKQRVIIRNYRPFNHMSR